MGAAVAFFHGQKKGSIGVSRLTETLIPRRAVKKTVGGRKDTNKWGRRNERGGGGGFEAHSHGFFLCTIRVWTVKNIFQKKGGGAGQPPGNTQVSERFNSCE